MASSPVNNRIPSSQCSVLSATALEFTPSKQSLNSTPAFNPDLSMVVNGTTFYPSPIACHDWKPRSPSPAHCTPLSPEFPFMELDRPYYREDWREEDRELYDNNTTSESESDSEPTATATLPTLNQAETQAPSGTADQALLEQLALARTPQPKHNFGFSYLACFTHETPCNPISTDCASPATFSPAAKKTDPQQDANGPDQRGNFLVGSALASAIADLDQAFPSNDLLPSSGLISSQPHTFHHHAPGAIGQERKKRLTLSKTARLLPLGQIKPATYLDRGASHAAHQHQQRPKKKVWFADEVGAPLCTCEE